MGNYASWQAIAANPCQSVGLPSVAGPIPRQSLLQILLVFVYLVDTILALYTACQKIQGYEQGAEPRYPGMSALLMQHHIIIMAARGFKTQVPS